MAKDARWHGMISFAGHLTEAANAAGMNHKAL